MIEVEVLGGGMFVVRLSGDALAELCRNQDDCSPEGNLYAIIDAALCWSKWQTDFPSDFDTDEGDDELIF